MYEMWLDLSFAVVHAPLSPAQVLAALEVPATALGEQRRQTMLYASLHLPDGTPRGFGTFVHDGLTVIGPDGPLFHRTGVADWAEILSRKHGECWLFGTGLGAQAVQHWRGGEVVARLDADSGGDEILGCGPLSLTGVDEDVAADAVLMAMSRLIGVQDVKQLLRQGTAAMFQLI